MHRWKFSALAAAACVSAALTTTDAAALALGPLSVQSALGENLRAEIAIAQMSNAEAETLLARIASPDVFRAQGMDYSSAARNVQVALQRRPNGAAVLVLTSNSPVNDPFLDLVVETNWNTGHLLRSYTVLLDPPATPRAAATVLPPQVTPPRAAAPRPAPASQTGRTYSSDPSVPTTRVQPAAPAAPTAAAEASSNSVRVRSGSTAGEIASAHRPRGVSLDQMLVAMLRGNPEAFIDGNVNRIRAGAVLQLPSREQALATPAAEARQIVAAQSRDFNAFRRGLAAKAPQATVQAADRAASGQVQAQVQDSSPAAAPQDKLTLSKGDTASNAAQEAQVAAQKQSAEQDSRLNELQRNLSQLQELAQNTPPATPATTTAAEAAPAVPDAATTATGTPGITVAADSPTLSAAPDAAASTTPADAKGEAAATEAASEAASENTTAPETPAATASEATSPAAVPALTPAPASTPASSSFLDDLLANPLIPGVGAALALLLGLLGYNVAKRRRAQNEANDPSLGDSQLQPDSFFGGSGGQQVDTNSSDGATTMAYSPSQLDGGGDVDPVAEADVYLAYGRDAQAEEILKEAMRNQPQRLAIPMKLAEIYAKRKDLVAFETTARGVHNLTQGQGADWQRMVELGHSIDPNNRLYTEAAGSDSDKPAGASFADALQQVQPGLAAGAAAAMADLPNLDLDLPEGLAAQQVNTSDVPELTDFDLPTDTDFAEIDPVTELDSQLDVNAVPQDPPTLIQDTIMAASPAEAARAMDLGDLQLDTNTAADVLDLDMLEVPAPAPATPAAEAVPTLDLGASLDFDLGDDVPAPAPAAEAESAPQDLDFDLNGLDLDMGDAGNTVSSTASEAAPATEEEAGHNRADDPLATKLDLAQEFNTIGDSEGARALIEEVLAEANGLLKERAQKMLSEID